MLQKRNSFITNCSLQHTRVRQYTSCQGYKKYASDMSSTKNCQQQFGVVSQQYQQQQLRDLLSNINSNSNSFSALLAIVQKLCNSNSFSALLAIAIVQKLCNSNSFSIAISTSIKQNPKSLLRMFALSESAKHYISYVS